MKEKTIVISEATSGIGQATALKLASFGSQIVMIARDLQKAKMVKESFLKTFPEAKIDAIYADFMNLDSLPKACEEISSKYGTVDILINNAGLIYNKFQKTKNNMEVGLQVNHMGPFLLTELLKPSLKKANEPRIVNVSSEMHKLAKFDQNDLNLEKGFSGWKQYANTKLYNIFTSKYWSKEVNSFALHPGVVKTNFGTNNTGFWAMFNKMPFIISPEEGAKTSIYLASQELSKLENGAYYQKSARASSSAASRDPEALQNIINTSKELLEKAGFKL